MTNIEQLNIKINVKGGIEGTIKQYKYNVNTDLKSKNSKLYTPTQYNLTANATKNSKLKDISLYSDRDRLEDFLKKTTSTNGDKEKNIQFILRLLFKKNSKFFIKDWQFTVDKTVENKDITINPSSTIPKSLETLKKEALRKKHAEIRKKIEEPYDDLPTADYAYYEPIIKKQIVEAYHSFLTNTVERDAYIKKYRAEYRDRFNEITVELELIPSEQLAHYVMSRGTNIPTKYRPKIRDCKSKREQMHTELMDLLCSDPSVIAATTAKTNKYTKKLNKLRQVSRDYIGQTSKDFPFCKPYKLRSKKRSSKSLTVENLPNKPANLPSNTKTRKTRMFLR